MPIMDVKTQWEEFQKGAIDFTWVPADQMTRQRGRPEVQDGTWQAKAWPSLAVIMVGMSQKSPRLGGDANLARRQALSYAVDRAAVIAVTGDAGATPASACRPRGSSRTASPTSTPAASPIRPTRRRPSSSSSRSRPCRPSSTSPGGPWPRRREGLAIIDEPLLSGWRSAGLDVARQGYEWNTYVREVSKGTEGDLFLTGWLADYPSPDNFLYPLFHSSSSGAESHRDLLRRPGGRPPARGGPRHPRREPAARPVRAGGEEDPRRRPRDPAVLLRAPSASPTPGSRARRWTRWGPWTCGRCG